MVVEIPSSLTRDFRGESITTDVRLLAGLLESWRVNIDVLIDTTAKHQQIVLLVPKFSLLIDG